MTKLAKRFSLLFATGMLVLGACASKPRSTTTTRTQTTTDTDGMKTNTDASQTTTVNHDGSETTKRSETVHTPNK